MTLAGIVIVAAGMVAILGGLLAVLRVLVSISMRLGSFTERVNEHIKLSVQIHSDQEARLRNLENHQLERRYRRDQR